MEIGFLMTRVKNFYEESNSNRLKTNLDLLEEIRERAQICMETYKQRVTRYYNAWIKPKLFRKGNLVLHRAEAFKPSEQKKLAPNWEGPYWIIEVIRS